MKRPVALAAHTATPTCVDNSFQAWCRVDGLGRCQCTSKANGVEAQAATAQVPVAPTQASTIASLRPKKSAAAAQPTAPII